MIKLKKFLVILSLNFFISNTYALQDQCATKCEENNLQRRPYFKALQWNQLSYFQKQNIIARCITARDRKGNAVCNNGHNLTNVRMCKSNSYANNNNTNCVWGR
jgi:hypothetical protein